MYALLFGFSSSVIQFSRFSKFLESFWRRLLFLLWSLYVDDSSIVDFASAKGSAQKLGVRGLGLLGVEQADHKRHLMSPSCEFLGVEHDLSLALSKGVVIFNPKRELQEKVRDLIEDRMDEGQCTPAQASKIRGVAGFTATAIFGRLGRVGMAALKQRQYTDTSPWGLSFGLLRNLTFLHFINGAVAAREVDVLPHPRPVVIIATDAQADTSPTGGSILLVDGVLSAGFFSFALILPVWGKHAGDACIAECECAMVVLTIWYTRDSLRGRQIIWVVDNSASLFCLIKGVSNNPVLERLVAVFHFICHWFHMKVYFEYVDSKSNFSDGISRVLDKDPWCRKHCVHPKELAADALPRAWFDQDYPDLWAQIERSSVGV
jgi:hypothetical protein